MKKKYSCVYIVKYVDTRKVGTTIQEIAYIFDVGFYDPMRGALSESRAMLPWRCLVKRPQMALPIQMEERTAKPRADQWMKADER